MNDSVFDRLYECTINDGNDEYLTGEFYKSEAIRYMAETEALKTELQSCRNRYKLDQIKRDMSYEQLRIALKKLEREITSKDREIKKLTTSIKNFQRFESTNLKVPDRFETEKMNHKDIAFKTRIVLEKISNDKQRYSCTGRFETISDRIDEVRTLFNQLLKQLNDFNSENKDISKTLASLLQLDEAQTQLRAYRDVALNPQGQVGSDNRAFEGFPIASRLAQFGGPKININ